MLGNFLSGLAVDMSGTFVGNVTVLNSTHAVLDLPQQNSTGYRNFTFLSPDGGNAFYVEEIYYTEDCPFEGAPA